MIDICERCGEVDKIELGPDLERVCPRCCTRLVVYRMAVVALVMTGIGAVFFGLVYLDYVAKGLCW